MKKLIENREEQGFTLIELLIAIVVVGILAAVAIVGIAGLTNTGSKSACTQSKDAATAASAAYYANHNNVWPANFTQLTGDTPPVYDKGTATIGADPKVLTQGSSWTLTMSNGGTTQPSFACS